MSVPRRNWNSKGKHWCWLLGEMIGFLLHSWGLGPLSDCHILGCVLAAVAPGDRKPCWAGNLLWCWFRKADGEDARRCLYCDIWSKMSPGRELLYVFHNFSYKQPAWRRAWKMQRVMGFFILGCVQLLHLGPWERTELWFIIFQLTAKAD